MSKPLFPNEFWARDIRFSLSSNVLIMGVLNVTPDSFSDGGHYLDSSKAKAQVEQMVEEGADIIDIGGESTRPGAEAIDEKEEMRRLKPVFQTVGPRCQVPLSIDTRKATVAQLALDFGAVMVNDISALRNDPRMGPVVAQAKAGLILMHMQGSPQCMQKAPFYVDVVGEIKHFLADRLCKAMEYGISSECILLDPGIGFGKKVSHNLSIIRQLRQFVDLGRPLMIGVSKKSFIGQIIEKPVEHRCMGTAAAVTAAILQGVQVIRVHDVGLMRDVVKMAQALRDSCIN